jgi:hypothetical protein
MAEGLCFCSLCPRRRGAAKAWGSGRLSEGSWQLQLQVAGLTTLHLLVTAIHLELMCIFRGLQTSCRNENSKDVSVKNLNIKHFKLLISICIYKKCQQIKKKKGRRINK